MRPLKKLPPVLTVILMVTVLSANSHAAEAIQEEERAGPATIAPSRTILVSLENIKVAVRACKEQTKALKKASKLTSKAYERLWKERTKDELDEPGKDRLADIPEIAAFNDYLREIAIYEQYEANNDTAYPYRPPYAYITFQMPRIEITVPKAEKTAGTLGLLSGLLNTSISTSGGAIQAFEVLNAEYESERFSRAFQDGFSLLYGFYLHKIERLIRDSTSCMISGFERGILNAEYQFYLKILKDIPLELSEQEETQQLILEETRWQLPVLLPTAGAKQDYYYYYFYHSDMRPLLDKLIAESRARKKGIRLLRALYAGELINKRNRETALGQPLTLVIRTSEAGDQINITFENGRKDKDDVLTLSLSDMFFK